MRQIKFRGKALSKELSWLFGDLLHMEHLPNEVLIGGVQRDEYGKTYQAGTLVDIKTIGQFTGLKDKNGAEIYEGDIVLGKSFSYAMLELWVRKDKLPDEYHTTEIRYIGYHDGAFCLFNNENHWIAILNHNAQSEAKDLTVIGNIHDNPELLKGE